MSDKISDEWYTPQHIIDVARSVMGSIDVDPASCEIAQSVVNATTYYTAKQNGLLYDWCGNVWLNPPYSYRIVETFVDVFIRQHKCGNMQQGIILVNNYADTRWFHKLLKRYPVCFTLNRLEFWQPDKKPKRNRWGQAFFYAGPNAKRFAAVFCGFGTVVDRVIDIPQYQ